jgi:hypothetical protein
MMVEEVALTASLAGTVAKILALYYCGSWFYKIVSSLLERVDEKRSL